MYARPIVGRLALLSMILSGFVPFEVVLSEVVLSEVVLSEVVLSEVVLSEVVLSEVVPSIQAYITHLSLALVLLLVFNSTWGK